MASKLLNVLSEIENGRKKITSILKYKGYPLNDNSSFNEISASLDDIEDTQNRKTYIPYYELTPETDPELWHYPSDWPDVEQIFREQEDIEIDNRGYYPIAMFLFSEDLDTNTFVVPTTTQSDMQAALEEGYVNLPSTPTNYGDNYGPRKILKFSDNTISEPFNDSSSNKQYVKVWDVSKDIITNDGEHLRWVIVYTQESTTSNMYYGYNLTNLNTKVFLTTKPFGVRSNATQNENNLGVNDDFKMLIFTDPKTPLGIAKRNAPIINTVYLNKLGGIRYLKINMDDKAVYFNNNFSHYTTDNKLTQIYCNTNFATTFYQMTNLKYLNINQFTNLGGSSYKLKYLYVDDIATSALQLNELHSLIDTNIFNKIIAIDNGQNSFNNIKTLSLPNVTSITNGLAFNNIRCENIILENLQNSATNFNSIYLKKVIIPKLETLTGTIGDNVIYLDISGCKNITTTNISGSNSCLEYVDASSLEACNVNCFYYLPRLKKLILPDGFKNSISLQNCYSLPSNEIVNIFNKLADVNEETVTYTITVNRETKQMLTNEEIAIATDKGWVVQ